MEPTETIVPASTETPETIPAAPAAEPTETGTEDTQAASQETPAETKAEPTDTADKRVHDTQAAFTKKAQEAAEAKKKVAELEAKMAELSTAPRLSDPKVAAAKEKMDAAFKDTFTKYPELEPVLAPMRDFMDAITAPIIGHEKEIGTVREQIEMARAHPDADAIYKSEDFALWMIRNPAMRELLEGGVGGQITALNFYKQGREAAAAATKAAEKERKQKADALKAPGRGAHGEFAAGKDTYSLKEIQGMDQATYNKHREAILRAERAGKITP